MSLDATLLSILACPEDKGPLFYVADESILYNPRLRRVYKVIDDIPVMLVEESEQVSETEDARLRAKIATESIPPTFGS